MSLQAWGIKAELGSLNCNGSIGIIWTLTALKSWRSLHVSDFFGMQKMGVCQGLVEGSICPRLSCSLISIWICFTFSHFKDSPSSTYGPMIHWLKGTSLISVWHGMWKSHACRNISSNYRLCPMTFRCGDIFKTTHESYPLLSLTG